MNFDLKKNWRKIKHWNTELTSYNMALAGVRTFRALQEERVHLYRDFEEGFVAYLKAAPNLDFEAYKRLVHEISREFNRISQLIICEKETLKTVHGRKDLSSTIEKIQEEEASKLEMTAAYQIARQTMKEQQVTTTTTTSTSSTDGCGDSDAGRNRDAEMTKREIEELRKKMGENEATINELLEELKYQSEDLYEEEEKEEEEEPVMEGAMETEQCESGNGVSAQDVNVEMEEEVSRWRFSMYQRAI